MSQMENKPKPLLIVTDGISGPSGLARIGRDIATRIYDNLSDVYRLGVAGYSGTGSRKFPFLQYHFEGIQADWVLPSLSEIVQDFAGNERCIILFIADLHRLSWFSQPERLGGENLAKYPGLKDWLKKANIERWCYVPIDSSGPNDKLSLPIALTALGFDRLLAYGPYGEAVLRRTIGDEEADKRHLTNLPHGYDGEIFYQTPKSLSRKVFLAYTGGMSLLHMFGVQARTEPIQEDEILVGAIATNQSRKNWPLACKTISLLAKKHKVRFWAHTDRLEANWSIPTLLADYGIVQNSIISTGYISDDKMASAMSGCDLCLGIGPEGFGLPNLEALACSTPVITGAYAGSADFVPREMQVEPIGFYEEGSYGSLRPVYKAEDWAARAGEWIGRRTELNPRYDWSNLWPNEWQPYLKEAAK